MTYQDGHRAKRVQRPRRRHQVQLQHQAQHQEAAEVAQPRLLSHPGSRLEPLATLFSRELQCCQIPKMPGGLSIDGAVSALEKISAMGWSMEGMRGIRIRRSHQHSPLKREANAEESGGSDIELQGRKAATM